MASNINKKNKKNSELLKCQVWDLDARNIISNISNFDHKLIKVEPYNPLQLFSLTKHHLYNNTGVYIENFSVDINLKNECVYLNKKLDDDSKAIFSILASYSAQKHLTCWPSLPRNIEHHNISKYEQDAYKFSIEIDNEMSDLLCDIFKNTDLKRKQETYLTSFKTAPDIYFGKNKILSPNYRNRPYSTLSL